MRIVIRKDAKIANQELNDLLSEFSAFMQQYTGIKPQYFIENTDHNGYPTRVDSDGDIRIAEEYLKSETDAVFKKYGKWGTDHVVILVHEDNWQSAPRGGRKIWGTNFSNTYHGYQTHYVRFDKDNSANSFGTFYHEIHHSLDALIYALLGVNVAKLLGVSDWDQSITHGQGEAWDYIRHKENSDSLVYIAPYLKTAYAKRKRMYDAEVGRLKKSINLLQQAIIYLRQLNSMKQSLN